MKIHKIAAYSAVTAVIIAIIIFCFAEIEAATKSARTSNEKNGKVIVIDPGHGGSDPGAVSAKGTKESLLNLQVALYLKEYLCEKGFEVVMTRGDGEPRGADTGLSNEERKRIISSTACDMVVSIHMNKFSDVSVHGAETFYYEASTESKLLAEHIQAFLKNELDTTNTRTIKGVTNLFVLKASKAPSVLVECGYISNSDEESKLLSDAYQRRIAFAISCGILSYFNGNTAS